MIENEGGACVVVRDRESRSHGEGGQGIDTSSMTEEQSMDLDFKADYAWVLSVQRQLYQWSKTCELHYDSWRAGCITKGARPVRGEGERNHQS